MLILFFVLASAASNKPVKLSDVTTLIAKPDLLVNYRRIPPRPQLKCSGSSYCDHLESVFCKLDGLDDSGLPNWDCQGEWDAEVRNLGVKAKFQDAEVVCEGYENSEDEWILPRSCAVEARLSVQIPDKVPEQRPQQQAPSSHRAQPGERVVITETTETTQTDTFYDVPPHVLIDEAGAINKVFAVWCVAIFAVIALALCCWECKRRAPSTPRPPRTPTGDYNRVYVEAAAPAAPAAPVTVVRQAPPVIITNPPPTVIVTSPSYRSGSLPLGAVPGPGMVRGYDYSSPPSQPMRSTSTTVTRRTIREGASNSAELEDYDRTRENDVKRNPEPSEKPKGKAKTRVL